MPRFDWVNSRSQRDIVAVEVFFAFYFSKGPIHPDARGRRDPRRRLTAVFACLLVGCVLAARLAAEAYTQTATSTKSLSRSEMSRMAPNDLAKYVFENHGCKNCHTLRNNGKFGFTERDRTVGKGFEGCISMLTSMNMIAQVKDENRTAKESLRGIPSSRGSLGSGTLRTTETPGRAGLSKARKRPSLARESRA
jgi:hypothetical protein